MYPPPASWTVPHLVRDRLACWLGYTSFLFLLFAVRWGVCSRENIVRLMERKEFVHFGEMWEICHDCEHIDVYENSTHDDSRGDYQRMCTRAIVRQERDEESTIEREYEYRKWYLGAYDMTLRVLQPYRLHPGCDCIGCLLLQKCGIPYTGLQTCPWGAYL